MIEPGQQCVMSSGMASSCGERMCGNWMSPVDRGDELGELVEPRLDLAPVVAGAPVLDERLKLGQLDTLGPPRRHNTSAAISRLLSVDHASISANEAMVPSGSVRPTSGRLLSTAQSRSATLSERVQFWPSRSAVPGDVWRSLAGRSKRRPPKHPQIRQGGSPDVVESDNAKAAACAAHYLAALLEVQGDNSGALRLSSCPVQKAFRVPPGGIALFLSAADSLALPVLRWLRDAYW
jgi:hypothetical protein